MGSIASGDISDIAFWNLVESPFASKRETHSKYGIQWYGRYRDDILIMFDPALATHEPTHASPIVEFVWKMRDRAASTYPLKVEEVAAEGVSFLDVFLYKSHSFQVTGKLLFRPYVKDTAVKIPLSINSGQCRHVHASWPKAEVCRLSRRSSSAQAFYKALAQFKARCKKFMLNPFPGIKHVYPCNSIGSNVSRSKSKHTKWLVLPGHPIFRVANKALPEFKAKWAEVLDMHNIDLALGWSNAGQSLYDLCWLI